MFLAYLFLTISSKPKSRTNYESNVLYVGDSNISELLSEIPATILMIQLGNDRDQLAHDRADFIAAAKPLSTRCFFAIMDGNRNTKIVRAFDQRDTKEYYFYRYGKLIGRYNGRKTVEGISQFAMMRTGIPFHTFEDFASAQDFIEDNEISVVLFLDKSSGKSLEKYNQIASVNRDNYTFGVSVDEIIADEFGIEEFPSLVLFRKLDKAKIVFPDSISDSSIEEISQWLKYHSKASFEPFRQQNMNIYKDGKPTVVFFTPVQDDRRESAMEVVRKISDKYGSDNRFTQIDAVSGSRFMTSIGFSRYADPAVAIISFKGSKMTKYLYNEDDDFTVPALSNFIESFLDGHLHPSVRSSGVSRDTGTIVEELNAHTLHELAESATPCVVLYYESFDHNAESMKERFTDFATGSSMGNMKYARIDVASNDLTDGEEPKEYPAVVLYEKGLREPGILHDGPLTKDALRAFLEEL